MTEWVWHLFRNCYGYITTGDLSEKSQSGIVGRESCGQGLVNSAKLIKEPQSIIGFSRKTFPKLGFRRTTRLDSLITRHFAAITRSVTIITLFIIEKRPHVELTSSKYLRPLDF
jgi:hypothetical protein